MVRSLAFSFVLFASPALAADAVPRLDVQSTCRAAMPLDPQDNSPQQTCMKDEMGAQGELQKLWSSTPSSTRDRCLEETRIGAYPSYVEVLTCIQTATGGATPPQRKTTYRRPNRKP